MEKLILPVLPILGVVVGAILQFYLSKQRGSEDRISSRRDAAYGDYLSIVATIANTQMGEDRDRDFQLLSKLSDAKNRIAIYGTDSVIKRLAEFERTGAILSNKQSMDVFLVLVREMRCSTSRKAPPDLEKDIETILFGN